MGTHATANLAGRVLHAPPTPTTARRTHAFAELVWTREEMHTAATTHAPAGGQVTPVPRMSTTACRTRVCTARAPPVVSSAPLAAVIPAGRALHVPPTSTTARRTPARMGRRALTK
jgi:hypothetical protein